MVGKLKAKNLKLKTTVKILKVLIFVLLLYALPFTLYPSPVSAQTPVPVGTGQASTPSAVQSTVYSLPSTVQPTSPIYTDLLVNNLFHSFSCLAVGSSVIGQPCVTYQITKNAQGAIQSIPVLSQANLSGGALGATTSLIGMLYLNPPVRTADYLASLGEQFGVVKEARAQVVGSGAAVLSPILSLWQVSRNISYVVMIIIFVIIGLMVMFRQRINPQTVITAQAALPGLVIGLILITFSYFLAGLISDTAFIGTNLVGYYFTAAQSESSTNLLDRIASKNVLSIFTPFTKIVDRGAVENALNSIWNDLADPTNTNRLNPLDLDPQKVLIILTGFMVSQLLMPFGSLAGGLGQFITGILSFGGAISQPVQLASFALSFVAMAILIYAMFRLLLRLINVFLTIVFLTITAPFQFLAASLPGRQGIATNWILNMVANILAFPAVLAVFYFVAFILGPNNPINKHCVPPCAFNISQETSIVGNQTFPLFGEMNLSFIRLLLAFGALVALPSIPDIIARTVGRVGVAGQLIGQELGSSIGQGRGYAGQFQSGATGMAGQVGRLSEEKGLVMVSDPAHPGEYLWRRPTPGNIQEMMAGGTRAGQWTRFKTGLRNTFRR